MDFHSEVGLHPGFCNLIYSASRALRTVRKSERSRLPAADLPDAYRTVVEAFDVGDGWLSRRGVDSRVQWTPYTVPTLFLDTVRLVLRQPRMACEYVEFRASSPDALPPHLDGGAKQYSDFGWAFSTLLNWELLANDPDGPHASQLRFKCAFGVGTLRASLGCSWDAAAALVLAARNFGDRTAAQVLDELPSPQQPPSLSGGAGVPLTIAQVWTRISPDLSRDRVWFSDAPPP